MLPSDIIEKFLQKLLGFCFGYVGVNFWLMVALRVVENPSSMLNTARFRIRSRIIQPPNTRRCNKPRAHRARLKRDIEVVVVQPLLAQQSAGLTDRQDFGMGRGIAAFTGIIPRPCHNPAIRRHHNSPTGISPRLAAPRASCSAISIKLLNTICLDDL